MWTMIDETALLALIDDPEALPLLTLDEFFVDNQAVFAGPEPVGRRSSDAGRHPPAPGADRTPR